MAAPAVTVAGMAYEGDTVVYNYPEPVTVATGAEAALTLFEKAFAADALSAFGGVVAFNRPVDRRAAEALANPASGAGGMMGAGMAAGIFDDQGKLVAGLSVSAPADRLEEAWSDRVRSTASQISAALGHRAG